MNIIFRSSHSERVNSSFLSSYKIINIFSRYSFLDKISEFVISDFCHIYVFCVRLDGWLGGKMGLIYVSAINMCLENIKAS